MSRAFPWMLALSPEDRAICAQDLVDAARASFSTDQPHLVLAELTSWKETATAIAAGLNRGEPEWMDDDAQYGQQGIRLEKALIREEGKGCAT